MSSASATHIALLRGINVGGKHKLPMAELRALCTALGWAHVRTYIQSGNVVFASGEASAALEHALEQALVAHHGLAVPVLVRSVAAWGTLIRANPFPRPAAQAPNHLLMALGKEPLAPAAAASIQARAKHAERVRQVGEAVWIHYTSGIAGSKLTPAVLDRCAGTPMTARNWRTVTKLQALAHVDDLAGNCGA